MKGVIITIGLGALVASRFDIAALVASVALVRLVAVIAIKRRAIP